MNKKTIHTLVSDIEEHINKLNKGERLNITEEDATNFGNQCKDLILDFATPYEKKEETLRMSNIGKPARQLWYDINSEEEVTPFSARLRTNFLFGHLLEPMLILFAKMAGHEVTAEQKEVKVSGVTGHMDCKIDGEVVDIKTASNFAFKKFQNGTLPEQDDFGYMAQLAGYEEGEGTKNGGFFAINKENGKLSMFIPSLMDKPNIKHRIAKLKRLLKAKTPPSFCYASLPEGSFGNMKLPRQCTYCRHKFICHKDSNNGKGLRVFKYSKNYSYLTTVIKTPRVEEITNEW
tara:strand:+ start:11 stop:880 length:870 start_codon:yes stop_codon:yes gene_type:complete